MDEIEQDLLIFDVLAEQGIVNIISSEFGNEYVVATLDLKTVMIDLNCACVRAVRYNESIRLEYKVEDYDGSNSPETSAPAQLIIKAANMEADAVPEGA